MSGISLGVAFSAGLASFLSPCILPLVPVYLSVLGGGNPGENRLRLVRRSLGFILGFTAIFVILGATASFLGNLVHGSLPLLRKLGGVFMIVMGLQLAGLLPVNLLNREFRLNIEGQGTKFGGSFILGIAFAFGWTPCIGPVLAGILVFAGTSDTITQGILLLLCYALGLALPLILVAALAGVVSEKLRRFRRLGQGLAKISGLIMIAIGVLLFMNKLSWLIGILSR
ncbi:MAG: cytochrome c biogenesis CcdA family protein [Peptococcaceae bacterium]|nr:cytochrome c biogenesis CcdA family protein [Peptococcaceae bacterium]